MNAEMNNEEKIFYNDKSVTVTQSRFIANKKTYAMRNISSVSVSTIEKSAWFQMLLFFLGIVIAIMSNDEARWIGIGVVLLSLVWMAMLKSSYAVCISTNAGEVNSLESERKEYIQRIVNALNEAIIHRG